MAKSKKDALAAGLKHFFTGRACQKGHVAIRIASSGACSICARESAYKRSLMPEVKAMNKANKQKTEYKKKQRAYAKAKCSYSATPQQIDVSHIECKKERAKVYARLYYHANKERILFLVKQGDRAETRKNYVRLWAAEHRKTKEGKISSFMRKSIFRCLFNKKDRSERIIGYKKELLVSHIEGQFSPGMTWENHGEWHIDHIKPINAFILEGVYCPKKINALDNLRPLWAKENLSKGSKYESI